MCVCIYTYILSTRVRMYVQSYVYSSAVAVREPGSNTILTAMSISGALVYPPLKGAITS